MIARIPGWIPVALLGVGCSAPPSFLGPAGDASAEGGLTVATACADLASAECLGLESCSSALLQLRYGTVATCEQRVATSCATALAAPSTGNSAAISEACARTSPAWSCASLLENLSPSSACVQSTGALASGAACAFAAQCATGFCALSPNSACGACADPPKPGDSCRDITSCGQGLICFTGSRVCGTFGATGATCSLDAPCGPHLSCIGANQAKGTLGKCQASAAQAGSGCDPTLETGPGCDYDRGLVCNGQSRECAPLTISPAGGPCDSANHQPAACAASGTCTTIEAGASGTCVAAAADGQPCSTTTAGPACLPPARCIVTSSGNTSGTCQADDSTACK